MQLLNKTQQLERLLRRNFSNAEWCPGAKLPSEDTLMERFGVSRPSMREALNTLAADGILVRKHGSGTYLLRRPVSRVELYFRLENIATVSGYWYRDILHELQALGKPQEIRIEAVIGFGSTTAEQLQSLERKLSRPVDADLIGSASFLMSSELNRELAGHCPQPLSLLSVFSSGLPGEVILDYEVLADHFRVILAERGYGADFTLIFSDDPPEKNGAEAYAAMHGICDRITGGDRSRQLGIRADFIDEAAYQRHLEKHFLAWYHSSARTRAAVFLDDGIFSNCCRIMARNGIRVPEDLAVLTHANVGREFDFPLLPFRVGFDPRTTARVIWDTLFTEQTFPVKISPVVMSGVSLPQL